MRKNIRLTIKKTFNIKIFFMFITLIFAFVAIIIIKNAIIKDTIIIDLYGNKTAVYINKMGHAYLLHPLIIKTEFGNIFLQIFSNPSRQHIAEYKYDRFEGWETVEFWGEYDLKNNYDLNLFDKKIKLERIIINSTFLLMQTFIEMIINNDKYHIREIRYYKGDNVMLLWSYVGSTGIESYLYITFDGEILDISDTMKNPNDYRK